jgi:hypothetical protein
MASKVTRLLPTIAVSLVCIASLFLSVRSFWRTDRIVFGYNISPADSSFCVSSQAGSLQISFVESAVRLPDGRIMSIWGRPRDFFFLYFTESKPLYSRFPAEVGWHSHNFLGMGIAFLQNSARVRSAIRYFTGVGIIVPLPLLAVLFMVSTCLQWRRTFRKLKSRGFPVSPIIQEAEGTEKSDAENRN